MRRHETIEKFNSCFAHIVTFVVNRECLYDTGSCQ